METTRSMSWSRSVLWGYVAFGALLGAGAAIVMAMFAMIAAATYQGTGFFTPLYHIASAVLDPSTIGPAVVGFSLHLLTGGFWGARGADLRHATAGGMGDVHDRARDLRRRPRAVALAQIVPPNGDEAIRPAGASMIDAGDRDPPVSGALLAFALRRQCLNGIRAASRRGCRR